MFPVKDALMYMPARGKGSQGAAYYTAKNPPFGATFTCYLKEAPKTLEQKRKDTENTLWKEKKPIPYPSWDALRAEDNEEKPYLLFTITDTEGNVIRKLPASPSKGIQRVTWDLRYAGTSPVNLGSKAFDPMDKGPRGMMVMPGTYMVSLSQIVNGESVQLTEPQPFQAVVLDLATLPAQDRQALVTFQLEAAELARVVQGTIRAANELNTRIQHLKQAIHRTPAADNSLMEHARSMESKLREIRIALEGDPAIRRRNENPPTSISSRLRTLAYTHSRSTSPVTQTEKDACTILKEAFHPLYQQLRSLMEKDLPLLEKNLEEARGPWTPGRLPIWNPE
jgi:hypothetical protein